MSILSIITIAIALAMDALAVSISLGTSIGNVKGKDIFKIAAFFGVFQGLMPIAGWLASYKFKVYIESVDHWIAFILLSIIGGKMLIEALKGDEEEEGKSDIKTSVLIVLAIATSIDALVVGISFAFLEVNIILAASIIAGITFVICFFGVIIGKKCGDIFKGRAEILGGFMLIAMGVKILVEHLGIL